MINWICKKYTKSIFLLKNSIINFIDEFNWIKFWRIYLELKHERYHLYENWNLWRSLQRCEDLTPFPYNPNLRSTWIRVRVWRKFKRNWRWIWSLKRLSHVSEWIDLNCDWWWCKKETTYEEREDYGCKNIEN